MAYKRQLNLCRRGVSRKSSGRREDDSIYTRNSLRIRSLGAAVESSGSEGEDKVVLDEDPVGPLIAIVPGLLLPSVSS
jgi:hypothetical protein